MTLDKFYNEIVPTLQYGDYIVRIKYRYFWERNYRYTNEVLSIGGAYGVEWLNDWNEGESDCNVISFINVNDIVFRK